MLGRQFRASGLGAVVRELWHRERIQPPAGLTDAEVWRWLNRSDVAMSLVMNLVWDVRLVAVAASAACRPIANLVGGVLPDMLRLTELVVYGGSSDEWIECCEAVSKQQGEHLKGRETRERNGYVEVNGLNWQDHAFSSVAGVVSAVSSGRRGLAEQLVKVELLTAAKEAWKGLKFKCQMVDGWPEVAAVCYANELQLREIRAVIPDPGCFTAPFSADARMGGFKVQGQVKPS